MNQGKTLAQVRGDILADIEAIRLKRLDRETGAVIFQGYKEITATIHTEIALFKAAILAKERGIEFVQTARLGRRIVNEEDGDRAAEA